MKSLLALVLGLLTQSVLANGMIGNYTIQMSCGEVKKVRCAKPFKRLEPGFFGINQKYVIKTKFKKIGAVGYTVAGNTYSDRQQIEFHTPRVHKAYTYFSLKKKFQKIRDDFKSEFKKAKSENVPLYACEGYIHVMPFKYRGSHIYYSYESIQDAKLKLINKAEQHL